MYIQQYWMTWNTWAKYTLVIRYELGWDYIYNNIYYCVQVHLDKTHSWSNGPHEMNLFTIFESVNTFINIMLWLFIEWMACMYKVLAIEL